VFSLSPPSTPGANWIETILYNFNTNGSSTNEGVAYAGVTIGSNGVLYGTTDRGGLNNTGEVYSLTPPSAAGGAWTITVLHNFASGASGGAYVSYANVVIGEAGVLYGTTYGGGPGGVGTVFSLEP
jgi:uncharacterized repeat protein (TIGR03803 family)